MDIAHECSWSWPAGKPTISLRIVLGPITGVFRCFAVSDKTRFTKRPKIVPQRDAVATDESAADRRADAQIDRSSSGSASDAFTICVKYEILYIDGKLRIR
eukprot:6180558-Pleurochrysis_carterae.AAC.1